MTFFMWAWLADTHLDVWGWIDTQRCIEKYMDIKYFKKTIFCKKLLF